MSPLCEAVIPPTEIAICEKDMFRKWEEGDEVIRAAVATEDPHQAQEIIHALLWDELREQEVYRNELYQVAVRRDEFWIHLSIKRNDRAPIHDWRELQEIKNQILGQDAEAVELFPAESRLVDSANQYHLWSPNKPGYRFPFGFEVRLVSESSIGKSQNRKFTT